MVAGTSPSTVALRRVELNARSADRAVRFDLGLPTLSADISGRGSSRGWPFEARGPSQEPGHIARGAAERTIALPDTSATVTASADVAGSSISRSNRQESLPFRDRRTTPGAAFGSFSQDASGSMGVGQLWSHSVSRSAGSRWGSRGPERRRCLVALEGRIEDRIAFLPPGILITPWLVKGPVRAQVSLDQDGDRFAITGDGDATIDRLMRAEGELARGVHLQARIRGSAIEFSGADGVVLGAPFSATGRLPLAWAVPAWLADAAVARGDVSPIEATVSARSDAMLAPALQALGIKNTNMSGTATIAIEAHAAEPRLDDVVATATIEDAEVSVDDLSLTQQDRPACDSIAGGWKLPHSTGRDLARSSRPRARSAFSQAPKESFELKGAPRWGFSA